MVPTIYIKTPSPDNLALTDSFNTTYNQITDTSFSISYYQIAVRRDVPCFISSRKSTGDPFSQSVSNLEDNLKYVKVDGISLSQPFTVRPNPFRNELVVECNILKPEHIKMEFYNMLGIKLYEYSTNKLVWGSYKKVILSTDLVNASELNILKVTMGDKIYCKKNVKN